MLGKSAMHSNKKLIGNRRSQTRKLPKKDPALRG